MIAAAGAAGNAPGKIIAVLRQLRESDLLACLDQLQIDQPVVRDKFDGVFIFAYQCGEGRVLGDNRLVAGLVEAALAVLPDDKAVKIVLPFCRKIRFLGLQPRRILVYFMEPKIL